MIRTCLYFALGALFTGCLSRDLEVHTALPPIPEFANAPAQEKVPLPINDMAWWATFEDPQLTALVERSLQDNRSLTARRAQLARTEALYAEARAELWPSFAAKGQLGSEETLIDPDGTTQGLSYGLGAQWKLDLFGQESNRRAAAAALAYAAEDELEAARLATATGTAATYLGWLNLRAREAILEESIALAQKTVTVLDSFCAEGQVNSAEVERARGALASVRARLPQIRLAREQLHNALAVLVGVLPSELSLAEDVHWNALAIPTLPAMAPSTVLLRRPDVRVARRQVQAQMHALGAAKAAFYPSFTFNFLGQFQHLRFSIPEYPHLNGPVTQIGLDTTLPLFTSGRIRAAVQGEEARLEAVAALYENTLLDAVADVENAYRACADFQLRVDALRESARHARATTERFQAFYEAGQCPLTDVLQAQASQLELRVSLLQAQLQLFRASLDLHDALGGFKPAEPSPDVPS